MQLFWIDIIGILIIVIGLILFVSKKFKAEKPCFIILYLTFLPIIVFAISSDLTNTLLNGLNDKSLDVTHFILLFLLVIEFVIVSLFLIIRYNAFPNTSLSQNGNFPKDLIQIDKARRILNWAFYSYIINLLVTIPIILLLTIGTTFVNILLGGLPGAIILLIPMDAYLYVIVTSSLVIVFAVTYIFTINGTLRFLVKAKFSRKKIILYIILMLLPIANLVLCIVLKNNAKEILRIEGIKVGVFGLTVTNLS